MNIEIKNGYLYISFDYDPKTVSIFHDLPGGRKYLADEKKWRVDLNYDNLWYLAARFPEELTFYSLVIENFGELKKHLDFSLIKFENFEPYIHQLLGASLISANPRVALFWEQGVGKTLAAILAIRIFLKLDSKSKVLIVCPKNVMRSWTEQFERFSDIKPVEIAGTAKKRETVLKSPANVFLINYDVLEKMEAALIGMSFEFIFFDESQFIKNPQAARSKAAFDISKTIPYRYLLTGTPIGNSPLDFFQQFKILKPEIFGVNYFSFRNKFFDNYGFKFQKNGKELQVQDWRLKPSKKEDFKKRINLVSNRITKADCLDLPPQIFETIFIEMNAEQKRIHREIRNELQVMLQSGSIDVSLAIQKLARCNQACQGFLYHSADGARDVEIFSTEKINALYQLWNDAGMPKMVVWTVYQHDIDTIREYFEKHNIKTLEISGQNKKNNDEARNLFQTNPDYPVIVCNEAAGGVGITLTASSYNVIYSRSFSLLNRLQLISRTHRIGQNADRVLYIDLIAEDGIEEYILQVLRSKRQMSTEILGDPVDTEFQKEIIYKFLKEKK